MLSCRVMDAQCLEGMYCFHLEGSMKAGSFETSQINDAATQCINLEDPNPQHQRCGKLESQTVILTYDEL